jgi:hypothetical protein
MLSCTILISSCGTARIREMQLSAREASPDNFVQTKDMVVHPVADMRKFKFKPDTLLAKQDDRFFARYDDKAEYVRLIKGPMNLYYQYSTYLSTSFSAPTSFNPSGMSSNTRTKITRYFDLGLDQPLVYFSRDNLYSNVKGCSPCMNVIKDYDKTRKYLRTWKFINWGAIGGALVIGFTSDARNLSDFEAYGFAGGFVGGLFSEMYRLTRVGKNEVKLEDAVRVYNQYAIK